MGHIRTIAVLAVLSLGAAACSSDGDGEVDAGAGDGAAASASTSTSTAIADDDASTADAPARPSAGCEAETSPALGETTDEVADVAGAERTWRQHVPASYDGTPLPVVIQMHGLTQQHTTVDPMSGYQALGEQEGFIVVTPAGRAEPVPFWAATTGEDNPDLQMIDAMLDRLALDVCIDEARVYASGISNGGLMSFALSCARADRIAAIAPVAGIVLPEPCDATRPVPFALFYGDADQVLPFDGGLGEVLGNITGGGDAGDDGGAADEAPAAAEADLPPTIPGKVASWAARMGCEAEPTVERVAEEVRLESWTSCDDDAEIRFYVVEGGGHTWPGSPALVAAGASDDPRGSILGHTTDQIITSEIAWEFFTQHALVG